MEKDLNMYGYVLKVEKKKKKKFCVCNAVYNFVSVFAMHLKEFVSVWINQMWLRRGLQEPMAACFQHEMQLDTHPPTPPESDTPPPLTEFVSVLLYLQQYHYFTFCTHTNKDFIMADETTCVDKQKI